MLNPKRYQAVAQPLNVSVRVLLYICESERYLAVFIDDANAVSEEVLADFLRLSRPKIRGFMAINASSSGIKEARVTGKAATPKRLIQRWTSLMCARPLMPNEIGTYLEKYFSSVEEPISELVSSDAIACVGEYSQGIPKRINTLFDVAVLTAKLDGNSRITREIVEKAKDRCKFSSITVESGGSTHGSNRKPELHTKKPTKRLA